MQEADGEPSGYIQSITVNNGTLTISGINADLSNSGLGGGSYTADGSGIELSGSEFQLELDGSTLEKSASGLKVSNNLTLPGQIEIQEFILTESVKSLNPALTISFNNAIAENFDITGLSLIEGQIYSGTTTDPLNLADVQISSGLTVTGSGIITDSIKGTGSGAAVISGDISVSDYMTVSGMMFITNLPTSDPLQAGRIWNNSGVLNVSSG